MIQDKEAIIGRICKELRQFTDVAVIGMSGGADSTLVAILCTLALGKDNVFSVHLPCSDVDFRVFNDRSMEVASKLDIHVMYEEIEDIANAIVDVVGLAVADELSELNRGNARSRARMAVLYGISSHLHEIGGKRVRVIGTGNLSEDYIGYDTKGGDALADIFPIGDLFKSEVYQLLDHFRDKGLIDEEHIDRVPSAGLWDGQTDEKELGHTYDEMEPVIKDFLAADSDVYNQSFVATSSNLHHFVNERHLANRHKHEASRVVRLRDMIDG